MLKVAVRKYRMPLSVDSRRLPLSQQSTLQLSTSVCCSDSQEAVEQFRYFKTVLQQRSRKEKKSLHSHHNFHTATRQSCFQDRCIVVTTFQTPFAHWFDKHWSATTTIVETIHVLNKSQHLIMADFVVDRNQTEMMIPLLRNTQRFF